MSVNSLLGRKHDKQLQRWYEDIFSACSVPEAFYQQENEVRNQKKKFITVLFSSSLEVNDTSHMWIITLTHVALYWPVIKDHRNSWVRVVWKPEDKVEFSSPSPSPEGCQKITKIEHCPRQLLKAVWPLKSCHLVTQVTYIKPRLKGNVIFLLL